MTAHTTDSGIPLKPVYHAEDAGTPHPDPGQYPYTRGVYPDMYRSRVWTMRQYAG
ncbi:MAG: methylmalonyl-CoA mutase family protein, partial [Roseiflexaceae bacterium]